MGLYHFPTLVQSVLFFTYLYDWVEERLEVSSPSDEVIEKAVPPHVNVFYCLGGVILTSLLFQISTGFSLTVFYRPVVTEAFLSTIFISKDLYLGRLVRSLHRWVSSIIILVLLLHLLRVYFTGGFTKPRELTWLTGNTLASFIILYGISGYFLIWSQTAAWACKIITSLPTVVDDIFVGGGTLLTNFIRGDFNIGQFTLSKLYCMHTLVLPSICFSIIVLHFTKIRKQGISGPL